MISLCIGILRRKLRREMYGEKKGKERRGRDKKMKERKKSEREKRKRERISSSLSFIIVFLLISFSS